MAIFTPAENIRRIEGKLGNVIFENSESGGVSDDTEIGSDEMTNESEGCEESVTADGVEGKQFVVRSKYGTKQNWVERVSLMQEYKDGYIEVDYVNYLHERTYPINSWFKH
jgi:hypothetical protein